MNDNLGASNKIIHEAGLTVQSLGENPKMDAVLSENLSAGKAKKKWKKRMKWEKKKSANIDEVPSIDQTKIEDKVQSMGQTVIDTGPAENSAEVHENRKRKKKRKREAKANVEVQREVETGSIENLAEGNVTIEKPKSREDSQSIGQTNMDIGSTENLDEGNVTRQRKKKRKSKAKINVEVQRKVDTGSLENLAEGNVTIEKPKNREDVQSIGQTNMGIRLTENLAEGNVIIENPKIQDDVQRQDQSEMDTGPTEKSAEVLVTRKRKKKRKSKVKNNVEVQSEVNTGSTENLAEGSMKLAEGNVTITKNPKIQDDVQSMDQTEKRKWMVKTKDEIQSNIGTRSTENLAQGNAVDEILKIKEKVQSTGMAKMDAGSKENIAGGNETVKNLKIQGEVQNLDQTKMDMRPAEIFSEGNLTGKRKKKRNRKAKFEAEVHTEFFTKSTENLAQSMDQTKMETGPAENFAEGKTGKRKKPKRKTQTKDDVQSVVDTRPTEKLTEGNVTIENPKIQDEAQSTDQTTMEAGPVENSAEGKTRKRKKKPKRMRQIKDEDQSVVDIRPTENLAVGDVTTKWPKVNDEEQSTGLAKVDTGSTENLAEGNEAHSRDQTEMDTRPTENSAEGNVTRKGKRKQSRINKAKNKDEVPREMDAGSAENLPEGNVTIKLSGKLDGDCISNCEALVGPMEFEGKFSPCENQEICHPYPSPITPIRRKLLVLDVNGLLADIVYSAPRDCRGDTRIFGRAVFKRPFCDDFLKFCFQNFDVGIWSSRSKKIIKPVVNYLLGDQKDKLLFCWDMDHATKTRFNTLENKHKPLVCKELSKIWGNDDCNLPWKKEDYDESNTLLLDDSPYKALLNPLHTAIFPNPYQYDNENDDSLGPGGNLRVYLEGLVTAENVQKYVEQHPFGQKPITEEHCSWQFYSMVLRQVSNLEEGKTSMPNLEEGKLRQVSNLEEGKTSMPNLEEGKTSIPNTEEVTTSMPNPEEDATSLPSPEEGTTSIPNPQEGTTSIPNPVEGTTLMPSSVEGTTSIPSLEEGTTSPSSFKGKIPMPSTEKGKTLMPSPEGGKTSMPKSMKGKDVKWVKARQTVPFKPKKAKAKATFLWPI